MQNVCVSLSFFCGCHSGTHREVSFSHVNEVCTSRITFTDDCACDGAYDGCGGGGGGDTCGARLNV